MQTGQFGNMLLLDDDPNLADSDKSYTEVGLNTDHNELKIFRQLSDTTSWITKENRYLFWVVETVVFSTCCEQDINQK